MDKKAILDNVDKLMVMYKNGELGGEVMPEDANPNFEKDSLENYLYFTLPMALNYQRNSYTLWESALKTYNDEETRFVFNPKVCLEKSFEEVQYALTKYRVALQKQKQTEIWLALCNTFVEMFDGDIRKLFDELDNEREYYKAKREESNERLIKRKGMIGKIIGFAPMVGVFVGYLIIPLVAIGLTSMTTSFTSIQGTTM